MKNVLKEILVDIGIFFIMSSTFCIAWTWIDIKTIAVVQNLILILIMMATINKK